MTLDGVGWRAHQDGNGIERFDLGSYEQGRQARASQPTRSAPQQPQTLKEPATMNKPRFPLTLPPSTTTPRYVSMVLSPRSLSYSRRCLASLFRNAIEPIDVTLITDSAEDLVTIEEALEGIDTGFLRNSYRVVGRAEADDRATEVYGRYPAIRAFRDGHPCWRKITDPNLFAPDGRELIVLDPDVYFPNPFTFEQTPAEGILLMYQRSNCLYPPPVVRLAFDRGIAMADHTDIGVCHWRAGFDPGPLERLIERLGGDELPADSMHVESIVWAALAMEEGGGYLDPAQWLCWNNSVMRRVMDRMVGRPLGKLQPGRFAAIKAFHAGGRAKYLLAEGEDAGLFEGGGVLDRVTPILPYEEYPRWKWEGKQFGRQIALSLKIPGVLT